MALGGKKNVWRPTSVISVVSAVSAVCVACYVYSLLAPSTQSNLHRFGSFAPVRDGRSEAKWFVDGRDYMSAVADAILEAKHEIFITGLEINPHIFLKRLETGVSDSEWRLDKLLLKKARKVHIYILLYRGVPGFFDTGSEYVKQALYHDNISVTFTSRIDLRWTHHEKIIVIDRRVAFVGGIDLAFGRWDTHHHGLVDDYPLHPCIKEEIDNEQTSRASHSRIEEEIDNEQTSCDVHPLIEEEIDNEQTLCDAQSISSRLFNDNHMKYQQWIGKDYRNTFVGGETKKFNEPFIDYVNRSTHPRMPWHDVSCAFTGPAVLDVAKHFIQQYNFSTRWCPLCFPERQKLASMNRQYCNSEMNYTLPNPSATNISIQVVRSWSGGQPQEASIHKAYCDEIERSKHLIYIENQFFISSIKNKVYNQIQNSLYKRIVTAYEKKQDFHVYIVLPLKPEFVENTAKERNVNKWNNATLFDGENSLMGKLSKNMSEKEIDHYLSVYGLYTHGTLNNSTVTEIIYVHSKLMIVDDRLTIVGSANINDRSMLGNRDSEVNMVIKDRELINGKMNGRNYGVGRFSHSLRCHLFKEHLGLLEIEKEVQLDPEDPLKREFYMGLSEIASKNTEIYKKVLSNKSKDEDVNEENVKMELNHVQGRIVLFQLKDSLKSSQVLSTFEEVIEKVKEIPIEKLGIALNRERKRKRKRRRPI